MKKIIMVMGWQLSLLAVFAQAPGKEVPDSIMQKVYNEVKTPYKYGLVLVPENDSKKIDCPSVFRQGNTWFMTYLVFDGRGYETWLAQSNDLLHWQTKGRLLSFSKDTTLWDANQKAGYIALQDPQWGGSYKLQPYNKKYWMSYFGGNATGYEAGLLSLGMANTPNDPSKPHEWQRQPQPILSSKDADVRWWENKKQFKSTVLWDKQKTTGHPFVMYYNANGDTAVDNKKTRWFERIGMAVSNDMVHWKRFQTEPVVHHPVGITGDPQIQKINNVWVMFYFGAFWQDRKGAFNRFACSYDLVNWTDWQGDHLIASSAPYDERFAHKSYVIKYKGVVYHFYCAVNNKDQRGIAVATSKDMGESNVQFDNYAQKSPRQVVNFNKDWKFFLGDTAVASKISFNDGNWRTVTLPHDWSIEGAFSEKHPATNQGGALPGGIGWYRKTFTMPASGKGKQVRIEFDGVYRNCEVWINGHYLGKRPYGYSSFQYDLTPYCNTGTTKNVLAVKVDNSAQPNSRWYSGSGIYRNVRLVLTNSIAVDHWGSFVTTPSVNEQSATVRINTTILNRGDAQEITLVTSLYDKLGKLVASTTQPVAVTDSTTNTIQTLTVTNPLLWSIEQPNLYKAVTRVLWKENVLDEHTTTFGIRSFRFDAQKGFFLNEKPMKILGVCMHHDLGALGAAINVAAMRRQLQILKEMGCNAIRTAHNPPAPELLDLCDSMGFLVMDEAFDMWRKKKNKFDYSLDFDQWHQRDLEDMVKRDRNHPSVIMWSIGNEIREQFDSTGIPLTQELVRIVKQLDSTRPVMAALTELDTTKNFMYQANALDLLGLNYNHQVYAEVPKRYPGKKFLATETNSALASRGHYDMPSDSVRYWPARGQKFVEKGNPDFTVSAYDHVAAYWGSTHEATWKVVKQYDFISGLFVWSGFDFLGEPVPYPWPARSSYYGIIDLAGIPKDVYYMYQSEWTNKPVLHIFPHWNWTKGQVIDVWAYYNNADEVELFLNNRSLGIRKKQPGDLHVQWQVKYEPGTLTAISRKSGKNVLSKTIKTASAPARLELAPDKKILHANGQDLSFITIRVVDHRGNLVPDASNQLTFEIKGQGTFAGADNGYPADLESFKALSHKAYNGICVATIKSKEKAGNIQLTVHAKGLPSRTIMLQSR